jgi:phage-related minor tail protein
MAMRQLPMQITDIATGLASGQSAFLVAIQQGGQLRDSFGGIGPAARALVGAINPLTIALGVGAGAFALIGKALVEGYQEIQAYERALISTGNVAGTTAGQLAEMADRVGEATGAFGEAESAALVLARSGKFVGGTLEVATEAAVNLAKLTGMSAEDAAEQIAKLGTQPSAALAKLNEQYHFLSASTYEQVKALEAQGRTQEAVQLAVEEFARVHDERAREAEARAGYLEQAWRGVKNTIAGIWEDLKAIGRDDPEARLRVAQSTLERLRQNRGNDRVGWSPAAEARAAAEVKAAQAAVDAAKAKAEAQAEAQRNEDEAIAKSRENEQAAKDATRDWEQLRVSNLDKRARLEHEIAEIRRLGVTAGKNEAEIEAQIAQARARFAESLSKDRAAPKGRGAPKDDAARTEEAAQRELERLQEQTVLLGQVAEGEKRVSEEQRVRYEIEQGAFQAASEATKAQLLDQARLLDAERERRAGAEEEQRRIAQTKREYDSLAAALRTPIEVQVDTAVSRIETLRQALEDGTISAEEFNEQVGRAVGAAFAKPPKFEGLSPEVGGFTAEEDRLDEQRDRLEEWYAQQLAMLEQFRTQKGVTQEQWNAQELLVEQQHQAALDGLARAQSQLMVAEASSMFGSMAQIAKAFAGEQSATYKVLFAISKGFAVAQLAVDLAQNVSKASAAGPPQNIVLMATALSQGAQIASMLAAAQYARGGRIVGPGTGTSDEVPIWASHGEYMVRAASAGQPGAIPFLEDFNARGMAALEDWQDWRGYAEGGLIAAPEPRARFTEAATSQASVTNRMRVYLLQDEDALAQRLAQHPAMEKAVVAIAGQNGNSIRAEW